MIQPSNLGILKEFPNLPANLVIHVSDLDVSASYPNTEILMNISKETTWRELSRIRGITEAIQRQTSINLSAAPTNSVEICTNIMKFPTLVELGEACMDELMAELIEEVPENVGSSENN